MRGGFGNGATRTQFQIKRQDPKHLTRKASKLLCDPSSVFSIGTSVSLIVESTCVYNFEKYPNAQLYYKVP